MTPLRIFIGYDSKESVAYHVLSQSIMGKSSIPVSITPIKRSSLMSIHSRDPDPKQSNEFSFTRFLVPYLSGYEGWSVYMDCDMLCRVNIKELFDLSDSSKAVQVVKHDYLPKDTVKYLGAVQYAYPKKNWSSMMLFNNSACRDLTPEYVNSAEGFELHQFKWLGDDKLIGGLQKEWNHLVGEYPENEHAKIVHWTSGGPYFYEYARAEYAEEYRMALDATMNCAQRRGYYKPFIPGPRIEPSEK